MKTRADYSLMADRMSELMEVLLQEGPGWFAIGLADGCHDSIAYRTREDAEANQSVPCAYVRIPEVRSFAQRLDCPFTVDECADYLCTTDALRDVAPNRTPIVLGSTAGLIGLPGVAYGAEFTKVIRRPGVERPERSTVIDMEVWANLVLHLPGSHRMASTDGSAVYLSIQEPDQFPCEISYVPTGTIYGSEG
ncbi:hypothetical protein [Streptomyces sp. NPDC059142]|uniref:hypothetical protein n=1 Tax=Streptomyces sp. NPDC059142 TaxID=3346739 RepID=UPI0036C656CE